jgi:hypothetical protein
MGANGQRQYPDFLAMMRKHLCRVAMVLFASSAAQMDGFSGRIFELFITIIS